MLQFYFFFQNPYDRIPERRISKPNRRINVLFAGLNVFSSIYEFGQYCFFIAFLLEIVCLCLIIFFHKYFFFMKFVLILHAFVEGVAFIK